jgi:hypothetical protein
MGALSAGQDGIDGSVHARAVGFSSSSKAPAAARLSSTRLLTARGLMRCAKSPRSRNGRSPRAATIGLDRLRADALQRRERIVDGVAFDFETSARPVDRWRFDA